MPNLCGPVNLSDAALLAAHVAGDRDAFWNLLVRHRAALHRLARRCTRSVDDADDAVQDALLAAHLAVGRFRREAAVGSWLHRIVVNTCRDHARRNAVRATVDLDDETSPAASQAGVRAVPDHIGRAEDRLVVRQALLQLPVEQRAAVVVVDMCGHSVAEAARLLGIAEGTVKSRRARARRRLSRQLRHLAPAAGAH